MTQTKTIRKIEEQMYSPKKLYWEDGMKTGDPNLDFQHKYLFETFNKLADAISSGQEEEAINTILNRLKFYAEWHFEKEEDCMQQHKCPAAETNKKAHAIFLDLFTMYYEDYKEAGGSIELATKIHDTLSNWLLNHVAGVDARLYPYIHQK